MHVALTAPQREHHRKQEIQAAYRRGDITLDEAVRRIDAEDNPPPQWIWTLLAFSAFCLGTAIVAAVVR